MYVYGFNLRPLVSRQIHFSSTPKSPARRLSRPNHNQPTQPETTHTVVSGLPRPSRPSRRCEYNCHAHFCACALCAYHHDALNATTTFFFLGKNHWRYFLHARLRLSRRLTYPRGGDPAEETNERQLRHYHRHQRPPPDPRPPSDPPSPLLGSHRISGTGNVDGDAELPSLRLVCCNADRIYLSLLQSLLQGLLCGSVAVIEAALSATRLRRRGKQRSEHASVETSGVGGPDTLADYRPSAVMACSLTSSPSQRRAVAATAPLWVMMVMLLLLLLLHDGHGGGATSPAAVFVRAAMEISIFVGWRRDTFAVTVIKRANMPGSRDGIDSLVPEVGRMWRANRQDIFIEGRIAVLGSVVIIFVGVEDHPRGIHHITVTLSVATFGMKQKLQIRWRQHE